MPEPTAKDACELLDADHIAVKHLFVRYARLAFAPAADAGGSERAAIAMKICDELAVHAQIEEEIFYPALRKAAPGAAGMLDQAREEHQQARMLVAEIRAANPGDGSMDRLVAALATVVEHHVKDERDELFPKARSSQGMDLGALGVQLQQRQRELQGTTV